MAKKLLSIILALTFIMSLVTLIVNAANPCHVEFSDHEDNYAYCYADGTTNTSFTGLAKNSKGKWMYFKRGLFEENYIGLAKNEYGWFYVENGYVDKTYTGLTGNDYGIWYVKNGYLDRTVNGMVKTTNRDWLVQNKWIYVTKAYFADGCNYRNEDGTYSYYLKNESSYTGLAKNQYGWFYMYQGILDSTYFGLAKNQYGWFFVKDGTIDKNIQV